MILEQVASRPLAPLRDKAPQGQPKMLLAVSGGVDSMVMAELFLHSGMEFGLAHCNFSLRGEESDGDEALVTAWAADEAPAATLGIRLR